MSRQTVNNWKIITLLSLLGALPAIPGLIIVWTVIQGPGAPQIMAISDHYYANPMPIIIHAIAGAMFCLLVPAQFSLGLRRRLPRFHRYAGRFVIAAGLVMALSALWILAVYPISGGVAKYSIMIITAVGMIAGLLLSLRYARARNIALHRIWMARALAVVFGGSTAGLVTIPIFVTFGEVDDAMVAMTRWAGLCINLMVVEWHFCVRPALRAGAVALEK